MFCLIFSMFLISKFVDAETQSFWSAHQDQNPSYVSLKDWSAEDNNHKDSSYELLLDKLSESNAIMKESVDPRNSRVSEDLSYILIYGAGQEYSFPPLMEFLLQRLQSRFSVYKFHDDSRPVKVSLP